MEVIDLEKIRAQKRDNAPGIIIFRSSTTLDGDGNQKTMTITVHVENGDVYGFLESVKVKGGIGQLMPNGDYLYIPWPCALVEIQHHAKTF